MTSKKRIKIEIKKQRKVYQVLRDKVSCNRLRWLESKLDRK